MPEEANQLPELPRPPVTSTVVVTSVSPMVLGILGAIAAVFCAASLALTGIILSQNSGDPRAAAGALLMALIFGIPSTMALLAARRSKHAKVASQPALTERYMFILRVVLFPVLLLTTTGTVSYAWSGFELLMRDQMNQRNLRWFDASKYFTASGVSLAVSSLSFYVIFVRTTVRTSATLKRTLGSKSASSDPYTPPEHQ